VGRAVARVLQHRLDVVRDDPVERRGLGAARPIAARQRRGRRAGRALERVLGLVRSGHRAGGARAMPASSSAGAAAVRGVAVVLSGPRTLRVRKPDAMATAVAGDRPGSAGVVIAPQAEATRRGREQRRDRLRVFGRWPPSTVPPSAAPRVAETMTKAADRYHARYLTSPAQVRRALSTATC